MPAGFEKCRANGGRIRTVKLSNGKYMHVCYLNGKSYNGEIKVAKTHHSAQDGDFITDRKIRFGIE